MSHHPSPLLHSTKPSHPHEPLPPSLSSHPRYTVFNSIGQSVIAINVETCSFNDMLLRMAHADWRANAKRLGHSDPIFATCDNPRRDGPGMLAVTYAGDGLPTAAFPGTIVEVETEAQCDAAYLDLRAHTRMGLDTENVAYIPPHQGVNLDRAALVQLCASDRVAYLFLVYKWPRCYASFEARTTPYVPSTHAVFHTCPCSMSRYQSK